MLGGFLAGMSNTVLQENTFAGLTAEELAFFEECEGIECKDDVEFAVPRMMMENNENFYNLAMAVTASEIQHYVATNEEVVYEAGQLKSIWNSIKNAIKRAWEKLKGFFKKIFDTISGWLKTDKKFVEKYEKAVREFKGSVEVSAYTYTHLFDDVEDISGAEDDLMSAEKLSDVTDEYIDNTMDVVRGKALGQSAIKPEDFGSELKKFFRNGKSEKESRTFTSAQADELLAEVKDCKDAKKAAQASYKACEKYFKALAADAKKAEAWSYNQADKDGKYPNGESRKDASKAVARFSKACNKCIVVSHQIMQAHVSALNAAHADAKNIIIKIAAEANKKKDDKKETNESASMLEGFQLI